ncbi:MAG: hypothetical protein KDH96_09705 [Candidatus Riesia sp.]|nr:hypothetical protein [Candidatus Riesia sp.]
MEKDLDCTNVEEDIVTVEFNLFYDDTSCIFSSRRTMTEMYYNVNLDKNDDIQRICDDFKAAVDNTNVLTDGQLHIIISNCADDSVYKCYYIINYFKQCIVLLIFRNSTTVSRYLYLDDKYNGVNKITVGDNDNYINLIQIH